MRISRTILSDSGGVGEVTEQALAVSSAIDDDLEDHLDEIRRLYLVAAGVAVVGIVIGSGLLLSGVALAGGGVIALGVIAGGGVVRYADTRDPEVTVTGVEKRYWTAHLFPRRRGTMIYDGTDTVNRSELVLEELENPEALRDARKGLAAPDDLPAVMPPEGNVESDIRGTLETVSQELENTRTKEIRAPFLQRESRLTETLSQLEAHAEEGRGGGTVEIPIDEANEDVRVVEELEDMAFEDDAEDELVALKKDSREAVETLSETGEAAVELMNDQIEAAGDVLALSTYNFYCPDCLSDDIESRLDIEYKRNVTWFCETCQSRFTDEVVAPKHRIKDELVEDIWDQLWIEKDDERRRTYERIEDQKSELKEREFEQRREEIRTAWDRIKDLRSKLRDLKSDAEAGQGAIDNISEKMVEYQHLSADRRRQFVSDVEQERREIRERTEEIIEETSNLRQEKLDEAEEEAERRAELRRIDEERRHREKMALDVALHHEEMELQERQHEENLLLETEGETSAFGVVNWWRLKKGEMFGREKAEVSD